jgi:hypothetical protein
VFIQDLDRKSYTTNALFAPMLNTARKERDDLKTLKELRAKEQRQRVREQLGKLPLDVQSKKPFAELNQWAQQEVVNPQPTNGVTPRVDLAPWDKELEAWEFMFKVKHPPPGKIFKPPENLTKREFRRFSLETLGARICLQGCGRPSGQRTRTTTQSSSRGFDNGSKEPKWLQSALERLQRAPRLLLLE